MWPIPVSYTHLQYVACAVGIPVTPVVIQVKPDKMCIRDRYGEEHGSQVKHAQLLMISEYGRQPTAEELAALVPFLP